jgi:hypothetical protein
MKLQLNYVLFLVIFGMLTWIIVKDLKDDETKPVETNTKVVYRYPQSVYSPWHNSYYPGFGFDSRYGGRLGGHRRHRRHLRF